MLLKHKTQELYAKAIYFPEDGMVARFYAEADKRTALMEGCVNGLFPLPVILENWDILPPSFDHLTPGDRMKRKNDTHLVQAVHGIGDLAFVNFVDERQVIAFTYAVAELKRNCYTLLPYDFIKPETVEVGGKTYPKAEVEKALEGVKEVSE